MRSPSFAVVLGSITSLVHALPNSAHKAVHYTRSNDLERSYDYIVAGGGTSGLTVADRLTEDGKYSVLVVEYGYFSDLPAAVLDPLNPADSSPDSLLYNITSVGTVKQAVGIGCVVGGGSAVNAQAFMRGTSEDYDRWTSVGNRNDSGWNWEGLLPYFKKSCTFFPPDHQVATDFEIKYNVESAWGGTGPILASYGHYQYPLTKVLLDGWKVFPGVEYPSDGSEGKAGVLWIPSSQDPSNQTRSYARTAHYNRVQPRQNYAIITGHKVAKINFSRDHRPLTATSVKISARENNSSVTTIHARKEIILAAGSIHTPQILQLSGIGPRSVLKSANIPLVTDLPGVGANFQDHSWFAMGFQFQTPVLPDRQSLVNNKTFADWALNLWQTNKTGPYSIIGGGGALAQLGLPVIAPEVFSSIASDIENQDPATLLPANTDSTIVAGYRAQLQLMAKAARSNNTAWLQMGLGGNPFGSTDQWIFNIHPLSRGTVNIDTSNPNAEPLVDYRMLSNPVDLRVAIALFRGVRDYFTSQGEMKRLSAVETKPGANVTSDEDIGKYLSTTLNPSQYHPVGTAAMLPLRLGGVVDDELKVHGVERLSIIDASIMPLIVGATTQSTVYAIAEKAADLIKARA